MTEEEAKTKWCPFVRFDMHSGEIAANRSDEPPKDAPWNKCIASACMAWRKGPPRVVRESLQDDFHEEYPYGRCGLAGHGQ